MPLFKEKNNLIPLAERIRPRDFNEFIGQEEIVGQGKFLRRAIENDSLFSMIFWGPPGIGKTTLAKIIANRTNSDFVYFSAVDVSTKEIKQIVQQAKQSLKAYQKRTILFLDEIHRFNKAQQAIFLPYVEDGSIILIASTTENPSFEVIAPLLSRCRVFILKSLSIDDIAKIIEQAINDKERGLGKEKVKIDKKDIEILANLANGDARTSLNILEVAAKTANKDKQGYKKIDQKFLADISQKKYLIYDKNGEEHYNLISAFIKSMRGSDADATIYWMMRMLEAGEDPEFIARRMIIFASEDIGNINPTALVVATGAFQALQFVGLPEARLNLSQVAIYLAKSTKSNASYQALLKAKEDISKFGNLPVPLHLRNAPTEFMKNLGYGEEYPPAMTSSGEVGRGKYPHNFTDSQVEQQYLPDRLKGKKYYYSPKVAKKQ